MISAELRREVIARAVNRCEYCRISQAGQEATFHIDQWNGVTIIGLTPTGRATVMALSMNRPLALAIRVEEELRGRHPE